MKIGILTQPLHANYGGVIQAWALRQTLEKLGYEPTTINFRYWRASLTIGRIALNLASFAKTIVYKILRGDSKRVLRSPISRDYHSDDIPLYCDLKFIKNKIKITPAVYGPEEFNNWIRKHDDDFDAYIVGSDQVWREIYSPDIETFFLNFLAPDDKRKKIAYAASFGVEEGYIGEGKLPNCIELLKRFDAVSVREEGGLRILKDVFHRDNGLRVLDPTLLLPKEDYAKIIKPKDRCNDEYLAAYILDENEDKEKIADELKTALNLPAKNIHLYSGGGKLPTVSKWLSMFADAEFVVTDSFHGCVFSIIFQKPFVAIGNEQRGLDRFTSLLSMFGLMDRLVLTWEEFQAKKDGLLQPIDYVEVDKILQQERQKSLAFLRAALT